MTKLLEQRSLRLRVSPAAEIRVASLGGRDHYIVPVVALVAGVVLPANVNQPEYIPADVLAEHPQGWDGRPVTMSHPQINGKFVSANSPEAFERFAYGAIYNTRFEEDRLLMEAWLDAQRIVPGSVAERSLEMFQADQMVEVSVGAFIRRDRKEGVFNGKKYYSIWRELSQDHLAILAEGEIGACSIDMGCGALRVASAHIHTIVDGQIKIEEDGMSVATNDKVTVKDGKAFCAKHPNTEVVKDSACTVCVAESKPKKPWKERFTEVLARFSGLQDAEDMTTFDIQDALDRALRASEPGYLSVVSVMPEAHNVVYAVYPEDRVIYYRRDYSMADGGEISLGESREEVQRVERYEPVTAAAAAPPAAETCGCHNRPAPTPEPVTETSSQGETEMNRDAVINDLITSGKFTEDQRGFLTGASDDVLTSLSALPAPQKQTTALAGASAQTVEQFIEAAPVEHREALRAAHQTNLQKRNEHITALKASGRCTFTDAELASKSNQEVEKLAALAAAPSSMAADFSGRGLPQSSTGSEEAVPEPPSLIAAIQNRGKK